MKAGHAPREYSTIPGAIWIETRGGDPRLRALKNRHYSAKRIFSRPPPGTPAGPGRALHLITAAGDAAMCYALNIYRKDRFTGWINCVLFRNEGPVLSSRLILEGDSLARAFFKSRRFFTFVNAKMIRSQNPGYCFQCAGYRRAGETKGRLAVLTKNYPDTAGENLHLGGPGKPCRGGRVVLQSDY